MFSNTFSKKKSCCLWANVEKCCGNQIGCKQYGSGALLASTLARPFIHTRKHSHTHICSTDCFSTATVIRERASVLRSTYIACLVFSFLHPSRYKITYDTIKYCRSGRPVCLFNFCSVTSPYKCCEEDSVLRTEFEFATISLKNVFCEA
jgi:hypothetical protein